MARLTGVWYARGMFPVRKGVGGVFGTPETDFLYQIRFCHRLMLKIQPM